MVMQSLFQGMISWWGRRTFSHVEIPSMWNSEATIISRNGLMTGHEGFFSLQNPRMRNCHLGSPAVLSLRSARTKTGERGGGKRGGEIWREILCARSLARSICGSCDLRNQTCATRHLFSY
jgi:hypothetical protein